MRPTHPTDQFETRSRKSSITDSAAVSCDRQSSAPTTFFLSRSPDRPRVIQDHNNLTPGPTDSVSTLQDTLDEASRHSNQARGRVADGQQPPPSRRRSTIKPMATERSRRSSSALEQESAQDVIDRATTPSPLPSRDVSLPSSPKSASSRSVQKSEGDAISEDAESQAIASSEEDEQIQSAAVQDSQPELIMPSIKMPSRRPFTSRGKRLGRLKILVAGHKGKTGPAP